MPEITGQMCVCPCHETIIIHKTIMCDCGKPITSPCSCVCPCHETIIIHKTAFCDCGKPITPPGGKHDSCPPPPPKRQPGVVDVPQPTPPKIPTLPKPPWTNDRPPQGDPNEIPWFRGKVREVGQKGPRFGPRKDEFLPFLLVRATSGDRGGRPFQGVFWESPDIFIAPNLDASAAPLMPPTTAGVAEVNVPNTLYAHVWNLGNAPAYRVRVEFYWFNPSLGIARSDANLIGAAWVDLGNRFTLYPEWTAVDGLSGKYISRGCHAIVRCPENWVPVFENQGHECLVVRAYEPVFDPVGRNQFAAADDRHIGQRNIAVVYAASPAAIDLGLRLGYNAAPADAEVAVEASDPASVEWLKLLTGKQNPGLKPATSPVASGFLPPVAAGSPLPPIKDIDFECRGQLLKPSERFHWGCDPVEVPFHASIQEIDTDQVYVLRIRQKVNSEVVGGYSVVLLGKQT